MAHPPSLPGAVHDTVAEALWLATALTPNHRALARTRPRIVCSFRWSLVVEHLIRTARFREEATGPTCPECEECKARSRRFGESWGTLRLTEAAQPFLTENPRGRVWACPLNP